MDWLLDGVRQSALSPLDRGLIYGDGVFRTLKVVAGEPRWWSDHLDRLEEDCRRLHIPTIPASIWLDDLSRLDLAGRHGALKLLVTRGVGERGYRPARRPIPTRLIMFSEGPGYPATWAEAGVVARICALRLGEQPALAGIKHLNRLENVLARAEWDDPAIQEGVLLDSAGRLISGTQSNIFLLRGEALVTPRLHRCGVAGVARTRLLRGAAEIGLAVREADLPGDAWRDADAILFSNSLFGLWWVRRLEQHAWACPTVYKPLCEAMGV